MMTLDERIAFAKDLIAKREEIDTQLAELFTGGEAGRRPYRRRKLEETAADETPRGTNADIARELGGNSGR